ncbi:hypothetical protein [Marinifilum sp.]|uniref:hypothetical protein n=1 Tax=Marinifilum sp. TaxID=2033137 RepID=UPI003BAA8036
MKTIRLILSIAMVFFISIGNTNAQFRVKKKHLQEIDLENTPVYVQTLESIVNQNEPFTECDEKNTAQTLNKHDDMLFRKVVKDHWYLPNLAGELSRKEIERKLKAEEEIWYIAFSKHADSFFYRRSAKRNSYFNYSHYELSLVENKIEVISIPLVSEELSELELHFAIKTLQSIINKVEAFKNIRQYANKINSNAKIISEKILLVSENLTGYSQEYLQQFYEGQVKIASEKEILQAIHDKDGQYAYLMITVNDSSEEPSFNHIILDCGKNEPLLVLRNCTFYSKLCEYTCRFQQHSNKLEFLFGFHFKKYQRIIDS